MTWTSYVFGATWPQPRCQRLSYRHRLDIDPKVSDRRIIDIDTRVFANWEWANTALIHRGLVNRPYWLYSGPIAACLPRISRFYTICSGRIIELNWKTKHSFLPIHDQLNRALIYYVFDWNWQVYLFSRWWGLRTILLYGTICWILLSWYIVTDTWDCFSVLHSSMFTISFWRIAFCHELVSWHS